MDLNKSAHMPGCCKRVLSTSQHHDIRQPCYNVRMFYVVTSDARRRAKWLRYFGTSRVPVKVNAPRQQSLHDGQSVLAYDLDASRLHPMARQRFADYVSRRTGHLVTSADVDGWPLAATGLETETAVSDSWQRRPFFVCAPHNIGGMYIGD